MEGNSFLSSSFVWTWRDKWFQPVQTNSWSQISGPEGSIILSGQLNVHQLYITAPKADSNVGEATQETLQVSSKCNYVSIRYCCNKWPKMSYYSGERVKVLKTKVLKTKIWPKAFIICFHLWQKKEMCPDGMLRWDAQKDAQPPSAPTSGLFCIGRWIV